MLLFIVAGAALLTMGSSYPYYGEGVGYLPDDSLVIDRSPGKDMVSTDGGLTWRPAKNNYSTGTDDQVRWGSREVSTPRGDYVLEGTHRLEEMRIVRIRDGAAEVVYAPTDARTQADVRFHNFLDRFVEYCVACYPRNMVYHAPTGNIVVAMGWEQSAIVGDADENWTRILLAEQPTKKDFSLIYKIRTVFDEGGIWYYAAILAVNAVASALAFAQRERVLNPDTTNATAAMAFLAPPLAPLPTAVLLYMLTPVFVAIGDGTANLLLSLLVLAGVVWLVRQWCVAFGMGCALYAPIASFVALGVLFTSTPNQSTDLALPTTENVIQVVGLGISIIYSVIAIGAFAPSLRQLPVVLTALPVIAGFVALAFTLGIAQGFNLWFAKVYTVVFFLLAAYALYRLLRHSQRLA